MTAPRGSFLSKWERVIKRIPIATARECAQCGSGRGLSKCDFCEALVCDRKGCEASWGGPAEPSCFEEHHWQYHRSEE